MRHISLWAFHHKWAARISLVLIYILLNIAALFFAEALQAENIRIPAYISYLLCLPFCIAFILYPSRKEKPRYKNFYVFRKTMDGILITISFLLVTCTMNDFLAKPNSLHYPSLSAAAAIVKPKKSFPKITLQGKQITFMVKHWKQVKKNYQLLRKAYKDSSKGGKVWLIALASLVAAALLIGVMSLSCNLSCSGNEGAAAIVLILGVGLIVFLLIKVIQRISRGPKQKEPVENKSNL